MQKDLLPWHESRSKNAYTDKIDIIPTGQRILIGTQNNNGIGVGFISTISCCT